MKRIDSGYKLIEVLFVGRRLCSDDSDFSLKSDEMCNFFNKRGYPASVVQAGHHRAQQIDRQSEHYKLNVTKREQRENSIHSHISPSQPRSEIKHSKKTSNYFKMIQIQVESFRNLR